MKQVVVTGQQKSAWSAKLRSALERASYNISDELIIAEICTKTSLEKQEVIDVLEGSRGATIEGIYRISAMLNVPAADLINPSRTVFQCYSADGGRPRAVSLTPEDSALIGSLDCQPLLYADDIDDSYYPFDSKTTIVFSSKMEALKEGCLYLVENEYIRYVRKCILINNSKNEAVLSTGGSDKMASVVNIKTMRRVVSGTEHILGRVLLSIRPH